MAAQVIDIFCLFNDFVALFFEKMQKQLFFSFQTSQNVESSTGLNF